MSQTYTLDIYAYDTAKTSTEDTNIVTERGVLQIRKVTSANGHKVEVYAGFSPETIDLNAGPLDDTFFDKTQHKYYKGCERSVERWAGSKTIMSNMSVEALMSVLDLGDKLTGSVQEKVEMAFGFAPTPETAAQKDAREKQEWAKAHLAAEDRIANDPTYGIF